MTGETGAGKSIIIDAVSTLLGARADRESIRSGEDQAVIEGIFCPPGEVYGRAILPLLKAHGLPDEGPESLLLAREINRQARNVCRVNGRLVSTGVLRQIGERLIDIHNQGEHLSLLRVRQHVDFLDRYAGLSPLRQQVARHVQALQTTRAELGSLLRDERELARRVNLLEYQIQEIAAARLSSGEEDELAHQRKLLANAEKLASLTDSVYRILSDSEADQSSLLDLLGEVSSGLAKLAELDSDLEPQNTAVEEITYQLQELGATLRSYGESIAYDPERLSQIEERLDLIFHLKRKYGDTIDEILGFAESAAEELKGLSDSEERIEELQAREKGLLAQIGQLAGQLSSERQGASKLLAEAMETELKDLGMNRARLAVSIKQRPAETGVEVNGRRYAFDSTGIDRVEFMISPNVGEPLKPLSKIASGGETARLMLAMKSVLSTADEIPVLIFDEIDAGLGGRAGGVVGRKLWRLTRGHQVLCVTHLPQLAAFGDTHFRVAKNILGCRTVVSVEGLGDEKRTEELAQMLGAVTNATHRSALEMSQQVREWKEERGHAG